MFILRRIHILIIALVIHTSVSAQNFALPTFADTVSWSSSQWIPSQHWGQFTTSRSGRIFIGPGISNVSNGDQRMYVLGKDRQLLHATTFRINTIQTDEADSYYGCGMDGAWSVTRGYFTSTSTIIGRHDSTGQLADAFLFNGWGTACGLADGGLLVTGVDGGSIIRLDTLGNSVWQYNFTPAAGYLLSLEQSVEHPVTKEITVKCRMYDSLNDSIYPALLRLDSNGIFQWGKWYYTQQGFEHIFQSVFNGEIYLSYGTNSVGIMALDAGGQPLWLSSYFAPGTVSTWRNCLFEGYDGNMYLYAIVLNGPSNSYSTMISINKSTGAVISANGPVPYHYFTYPQYGRDGRLAFNNWHLYGVNDIGRVNCLTYSPQVMYWTFDNTSFASFSLSQNTSATVKVPAAFVNSGPFANTFFRAAECDNPLQTDVADWESGISILSMEGTIRIVNNDRPANDRSYRIFNMTGMLISSGALNDQVTEISTEGISSGCYIVSVSGSDGFLQTEKVILR